MVSLSITPTAECVMPIKHHLPTHLPMMMCNNKRTNNQYSDYREFNSIWNIKVFLDALKMLNRTTVFNPINRFIDSLEIQFLMVRIGQEQKEDSVELFKLCS